MNEGSTHLRRAAGGVRATTQESLTRRNNTKSNMEPKGEHHQEVEGFQQANCEKEQSC